MRMNMWRFTRLTALEGTLDKATLEKLLADRKEKAEKAKIENIAAEMKE